MIPASAIYRAAMESARLPGPLCAWARPTATGCVRHPGVTRESVGRRAIGSGSRLWSVEQDSGAGQHASDKGAFVQGVCLSVVAMFLREA